MSCGYTTCTLCCRVFAALLQPAFYGLAAQGGGGFVAQVVVYNFVYYVYNRCKKKSRRYFVNVVYYAYCKHHPQLPLAGLAAFKQIEGYKQNYKAIYKLRYERRAGTTQPDKLFAGFGLHPVEHIYVYQLPNHKGNERADNNIGPLAKHRQIGFIKIKLGTEVAAANPPAGRCGLHGTVQHQVGVGNHYSGYPRYEAHAFNAKVLVDDVGHYKYKRPQDNPAGLADAIEVYAE